MSDSERGKRWEAIVEILRQTEVEARGWPEWKRQLAGLEPSNGKQSEHPAPAVREPKEK